MAIETAAPSTLTQIIVDLADMKSTNNVAARLTSAVLGSCAALAIYDPVAKVGGLLHFFLPESILDRQRALQNPYIFADTGIPLLFRRCYKLGAVKERVICKLAGGGTVIDKAKVFEMGTLNYESARKVLVANGVAITAEKVGGHGGMMVSLMMDTGRVVIKMSSGEEVDL